MLVRRPRDLAQLFDIHCLYPRSCLLSRSNSVIPCPYAVAYKINDQRLRAPPNCCRSHRASSAEDYSAGFAIFGPRAHQRPARSRLFGRRDGCNQKISDVPATPRQRSIATQIPSFVAIGVVGYIVGAGITYVCAKYLVRSPGFLVAPVVNFLLIER